MTQEIRSLIQIKNVRRNIVFLFSGLCFFLLVLLPSKLLAIISLLVLFFALFLSAISENLLSDFKRSHIIIESTSIISALSVSFWCSCHFFSIWFTSTKMGAIASILHLNTATFLALITVALAITSVYFLILTFNIIFIELKETVASEIRFADPKSLTANIKSNLILIISAFTFIGLNAELITRGLLAIFLSYTLIVLISSQFPYLLNKIKNIPLVTIIYSIISSYGICHFSALLFINNVKQFWQDCLWEKNGINLDAFLCAFSIIAAIVSYVAVFVAVAIFLDSTVGKLKPLFQSISKVETTTYILITISLIAFACFSFMGSGVFWGLPWSYAPEAYDLIYTADSNLISNVFENQYLHLHQYQNDLKQPLFAVFSAPFVGFGYALSLPFSHLGPVFTAIFVNAVQIVMLITANLMLAKVLGKDSCDRICIMSLSTAIYATLLFSIVMEQYVICYFWVIFVVYSYVVDKKASVISFTAAGGALLTNFLLLPAVSHRDVKKPKEFFDAVKKGVLGFLAAFIIFCRIDILAYGYAEITVLSQFAGIGERNIAERLNQYLSFISSYFVAPDAHKAVYFEHDCWRLTPRPSVASILLGAILLALCCLSFFVNRKNVLARISALWIFFSILLLLIVGWGAPENGMILYALYFGWAFLVLLFQLMTWISEKFHLKLFVPILTCALLVALSVINFQGVSDLLSFAFAYYPLGD